MPTPAIYPDEHKLILSDYCVSLNPELPRLEAGFYGGLLYRKVNKLANPATDGISRLQRKTTL